MNGSEEEHLTTFESVGLLSCTSTPLCFPSCCVRHWSARLEVALCMVHRRSVIVNVQYKIPVIADGNHGIEGKHVCIHRPPRDLSAINALIH